MLRPPPRSGLRMAQPLVELADDHEGWGIVFNPGLACANLHIAL